MPDILGPVEYIVIHFDSDRFSPEVVPALNELLDQGLVRLIDIAAVTRAADGTVSILETQELGPEVAAAFERLTGELSPLLSEADLAELGEDLAPGTAAAALLFEHVWATRFADGVRAANGRLVLAERIPHQVMTEAQASLLAIAE
ncbi:DUF6325 family protein [Amaricoccus sp.]|uniref:DUF6325 family protein n=1 Tax=Amaricoccus sp. TaxID=1872485 RepID=UPI0026072C1D|nr:DUF6325 family protein [Amaricoccus sp.]HRO11078.1 DUF6325 family protein [Amaricoccus sp.]